MANRGQGHRFFCRECEVGRDEAIMRPLTKQEGYPESQADEYWERERAPRAKCPECHMQMRVRQ